MSDSSEVIVESLNRGRCTYKINILNYHQRYYYVECFYENSLGMRFSGRLGIAQKPDKAQAMALAKERMLKRCRDDINCESLFSELFGKDD